jgi:hypothetical protein
MPSATWPTSWSPGMTMTMTMTMTIAMNHPLIKGTDMITKLDPTTAKITYVPKVERSTGSYGRWLVYLPDDPDQQYRYFWKLSEANAFLKQLIKK